MKDPLEFEPSLEVVRKKRNIKYTRKAAYAARSFQGIKNSGQKSCSRPFANTAHRASTWDEEILKIVHSTPTPAKDPIGKPGSSILAEPVPKPSKSSAIEESEPLISFSDDESEPPPTDQNDIQQHTQQPKDRTRTPSPLPPDPGLIEWSKYLNLDPELVLKMSDQEFHEHVVEKEKQVQDTKRLKSQEQDKKAMDLTLDQLNLGMDRHSKVPSKDVISTRDTSNDKGWSKDQSGAGDKVPWAISGSNIDSIEMQNSQTLIECSVKDIYGLSDSILETCMIQRLKALSKSKLKQSTTIDAKDIKESEFESCTNHVILNTADSVFKKCTIRAITNGTKLAINDCIINTVNNMSRSMLVNGTVRTVDGYRNGSISNCTIYSAKNVAEAGFFDCAISSVRGVSKGGFRGCMIKNIANVCDTTLRDCTIDSLSNFKNVTIVTSPDSTPHQPLSACRMVTTESISIDFSGDDDNVITIRTPGTKITYYASPSRPRQGEYIYLGPDDTKLSAGPTGKLFRWFEVCRATDGAWWVVGRMSRVIVPFNGARRANGSVVSNYVEPKPKFMIILGNRRRTWN
ncbi:MAG: hypothetical protein M1834_005757 [Cirrosporium novae-zelandiae]|nr:MAG: hypothetical protein M1834_005757 [Cirrosporium novae-zelandiae]